ncbi:MAG TPA: carbohydrate ABC transporter permease [Spirochaetia bacterium]|nr:carbohydrate ABC transporter permease [Spirochaetia bacterium]
MNATARSFRPAAVRGGRGRVRVGRDMIVLSVIGYTLVGLFAFLALFPFLLLVTNSFASEHAVVYYGFRILPKELSLKAYGLVFEFPARTIHTYLLTIFIVGVGTAVSLFLSAMGAFVLARKDVRYRNILAFYLYFTQLFQGGLVPYYLLVTRGLHLQDTLLVLLLVPMFNVINIFILRGYMMSSIPASLYDAAKIDGAGDFRIYVGLVLPLSGPALAAIGLFTALGYWNDWWTPMMFIQSDSLFPLQYTLYRILSSVEFASQMVNNVPLQNEPQETLKLAMTVIATGPVVLVYPFLQRYFVRGVAIGAVKG